MNIRVAALLASCIALVVTPVAADGPLHTIDLQPQANHRLDDDFQPGTYPGDNLSEMKRGIHDMAEIPFRIDDRLIEVAGKFIPDRPQRVEGIRVDRRVEKVYFLQGARWGAYGEQGDSVGHWIPDGTPIGYYEVNYADAETVSIPIVYGVDVRDWWSIWDDSKPTKRGKVVWTGINPHLRTRSEAQHTEKPLRLYMNAWENPHPKSLITSINLVSLNQTATPFCVAVTVEEVARPAADDIGDLADNIEQLRGDIQQLQAKIDGRQRPKRPSAGGFVDDFVGSYHRAWSVLNRNPRNVTLTKPPGMLTITTEAGGIWKTFDEAKNIFVIDNPIAGDADFVMTTRLVGFDPEANYNQAGLICLNDADNYVKCVLQWDDNQGGRALCSLREKGGEDLSTDHIGLDEALDEVWLRIVKRGSRYVTAASVDGQHYRIIGDETWDDGRMAKVGLIAKNGAPDTAPDLDASFDFFEIEPLDEAEAVLFLPRIHPEIEPGTP
jgi:regulation of enolase protein 1 (concanavalin A-like superfamily)